MPTRVRYLDSTQELPGAAAIAEEELWQNGVRPGTPPVLTPPPWIQDREPGNLFGVPEDDGWSLRVLPSLPLPVLQSPWAFDTSDTSAPAAAIVEEQAWQGRVPLAQVRSTWPLPWAFDAPETTTVAPSIIDDEWARIPRPIAPLRSVPPQGVFEWLRQDGGSTTPPLGPFCLLLTAVPSPKLRITPTTPTMTLAESGPKMTLTKVGC